MTAQHPREERLTPGLHTRLDNAGGKASLAGKAAVKKCGMQVHTATKCLLAEAGLHQAASFWTRSFWIQVSDFSVDEATDSTGSARR